MTNELLLADSISSMVTRLRYLEKKSQNDDETLALQRRQIDETTELLTTVEHNLRHDLSAMQAERDDALKRARDVQSMIDEIGTMALSGMRKVRGDALPPVDQSRLTDMAETRLPPVTQEMENRLPRPRFAEEVVQPPMFLQKVSKT